MTTTIKSSDGLTSFPDAEVYGIGSVRIMRHFEVVGKALDTPRHIRDECARLGFVAGERVIVADSHGRCKTVVI